MNIHKSINNSKSPIIKWKSYPKVIFIKACGNYVKIHFLDGSFRLKRASMTQVNNDLPSHIFCRIHKSTIVNIHHIKTCQSRAKYLLLTLKSSDTTLKVTHTYMNTFIQMYDELNNKEVIMTRNDPGYIFF